MTLPLTFWPVAPDVLSATRGGIRYRAQRIGPHWLCTVVRVSKVPPLTRGMAESAEAAQAWLSEVATEIETGRRASGRRSVRTLVRV